MNGTLVALYAAENFRFRVAGMIMTFTVLGGSVGGIVLLAVVGTA